MLQLTFNINNINVFNINLLLQMPHPTIKTNATPNY